MCPTNRIIVALLLILIVVKVDAQSPFLQGKVKNEWGEGVANALVLLSDTTLRAQQSTTEYVEITETDSLGNYYIKEPVLFNRMIVTRIGYKPKEINVDSGIRQLDVTLNRTEEVALEEVSIKGYRQAVKMNSRGLEYNMKFSPVKQGATVDALRFIPLVHIDRDNIQIVGKDGVKYFLNGQELRLSGNALNSYIQSISVKDIEKIEVITSYDPNLKLGFNQGGINIVTKRQADEGWNGNAQARIWKTNRWKGSGNVQLSYHRKKFGANLFFAGAHHGTWQEKQTTTRYVASGNTSSGQSTYDGENTECNFQGMFNYSPDSQSTLSGNASVEYYTSKQKENGLMNYLLNGVQEPFAAIAHDNRLHSDNTRVNAGLTYQHRSNKGHLFRTSINFYHGDVESSILARMDSASAQGLGNPHEHYQETVPQQSTVWSGDAVYSLPLDKKTSLAIEGNVYHWTIDNNDRYWNETGDGWEINELFSHHLKVKEWNYSGTISMQNIWSKKVRSVLGMGIKRRDYRSEERNTQDLFKQGFWQPHPFMMLSAAPSSKLSIRYSADYRLSNPSFSQMNPFKWYTSATTYRTGNPNLSQVKQLDQSVTVQFLQHYMLFAGHKYYDDMIVYYNRPQENETIESRPENMASLHEFTAYLSMNDIAYWKEKGNLRMTVGVVRSWYHAKMAEEQALYRYASDSYFIQLNNTTSLFPIWQVQMINSLSYNSKRQIDFTKMPASVNLYTSLQKSIKNWNINVNISVNSFLYGSKVRLKRDTTYDTPELNIHTSQKGESVSYALQISYSFGNRNVKTFKRARSSSSNLEGRVD